MIERLWSNQIDKPVSNVRKSSCVDDVGIGVSKRFGKPRSKTDLQSFEFCYL